MAQQQGIIKGDSLQMNRDADQEFFDVFNDEMGEWIVPRRSLESPPNIPNKDEGRYFPKVDNRLVGLALSGGGIRSATYALGLLQRMAKARVLKFVDFLSTVSGGGYLGASWSSLAADPEYGSSEDKFPFKFDDNEGKKGRQLFDRESDAVRHLRAHGYWLAPHLGVFDVWTWVALFRYLFSAAINLLLIPIPWVLVIMMLTLLIPGGFWNRVDPSGSSIAFYMWVGPAVFFSIFLLFAWWQPRRYAKRRKTKSSSKLKGITQDLYDKVQEIVLEPPYEGPEIKHALYRIQKIVLVAGIVCIIIDIFILGISVLYEILPIAKEWILSVGGPGAALLAAVRVIYNYFTEEMQGGVAKKTTKGASTKGLSFLVGIIGYVALAILVVVGYLALDLRFFPLEQQRLGILPHDRTLYFGLIFSAVAVATIMLFVPVRGFLNNLSMQSLYRRGMYKAYILKRNPYGEGVVPREKGFLLTKLRENGNYPPDMPYHLIVTAVNTSGDKQLKHLGRKSDSFVFANRYSGSRITGYAETSEKYKDLPLSEAMAISGAAVSPNMGRATTTSFSILLTLLNVRLGSWVKSPKFPKGKFILRPPIIWYWIKELFGIASADDRFIYLSDGGHFDNSAIYELLKRRCKYILAIDAGSKFDNLATVSRLARIDLGVQMDANLDHFKPDPETQLSQQTYVVAKIKYPPVQGDTEPAEGVLVWISTGMTKREKPDVLKYKETEPNFPFTSTGDQFFDQIQFEAYRQLGHSAAGRLLKNAGLEDESASVKKGKLDRSKLEEAFEYLCETAAS